MAFAYCCILCVCCRISLFGRVKKRLEIRSIELSSHYPQSYIPSFRWCSFLFLHLCTKTLGIVCHGVQAFVLTHFFRGVRRFFFVLIFISVWLFRFSSGHIKGKTRCGVLSEHIFFLLLFLPFLNRNRTFENMFGCCKVWLGSAGLGSFAFFFFLFSSVSTLELFTARERYKPGS